MRLVTVVLGDGSVLPEFGVPTPHRQQVADVVAGARAAHGVDLTVLRLLSGDGDRVTYLAERPGETFSEPDHPLRAPYARPGGPAASLRWAEELLGPVVGEQIRTWNLSSIWRLTHAGGVAWLKEVPTFFHHEPAVLRWLGGHHPGFGPDLLASDGGRMLLADLPGADRYGEPVQGRADLIGRLVEVQAAANADELLALGVPDRRADPLIARIRATVTAYGADPALLDGLDETFAALADCGIPDTLVHGDFHSGNVRGEVVLDWGDSFVGHPGFDAYRMANDGDRQVLDAWCAAWRRVRPGCEPERALDLLRPVMPLRSATVYAGFLDRIEPGERGYHADDVPFWLARASAQRP